MKTPCPLISRSYPTPETTSLLSRLRSRLVTGLTHIGESGLLCAAIGLFILLSAGTCASLAVEATPPKDLNTPRDFPSIQSKAEWQARALEIREHVLVSCGLWPMPERTPLNAKVFGRIERDGYTIEKVSLETVPGFFLAGNLYRPLGKGMGPFPAILNPHGHWSNGRLTEVKDGSVAARCINFARHGMIAFCYDMIGYNDTFFVDHGSIEQDKNYVRHRRFATNEVNLLWNISQMGLQTWNSIRALDFLAALPDADPKRLACTGESGGGTQTFMLGAADNRLALQAPIVMVSHTMQGGCSCENAPGLRVDYSNMEIAAAPAPRPQILVAATGDWTKDTPTVEGPSIARMYELLKARDRFHYVRYDFDHNYNQTTREAVYGWFDKWLLGKGDGSPVPETGYTKEPDASLLVFPDGKLPPNAATEEEVISGMIRRAKAQLNALEPKSRKELAAYRKTMLTPWQHSLQLDWPPASPRCASEASLPGTGSTEYVLERPGQDGRIRVTVAQPRSGKANRFVIFASSEGEPTPQAAIPELANGLLEKGIGTVVVREYSSGNPSDQFTNFFCTYNRTKAQARVRDLVDICSFTKKYLKSKQVVLCGSGAAGLWSLLAAPAADGVAADCLSLDTGSDQALLSTDIFFPGSRKMGGFQCAALLAAPSPLLLHNTGSKFETTAMRTAYEGAKATSRLRLQASPVAEPDLINWLSSFR